MNLKRLMFGRGEALSSSLWVIFFTTFTFLGFFIRDYLMAKVIGFGVSLDSFYMVMMLPMFFVSVFCIPLGHAVIPKLEKIRKLNQLNFYKLVRYFSFIAILISFILCLFTYFFSLNIFSLLHYVGWIKEGNISNLMLLMVLPILLLSSLVILANSLLLVNGHYIFPSLAQLIVPIFAVIFLVTFAHQYGVHAVIMGMVLGQISNFILVNRLLIKEDIQLFPLEFKSAIADKKDFWRGYLDLVVIAAFTNIAILVNTLLAASLGGGAVTIYNLGSKVSLFVTGIITSVFSSLVLPYFSRLAVHSNRDLLNQETAYLVTFASIFSIPFSLIIFLNAESISAFFFSLVSNEKSNLLGIASVMKYSIIQLPFWVANTIFLRHANSINNIQLIALIAVVAFIINLFLGFYLIEFMNVGGLALSSTISVAISSGLILLNYLYKKVISLFDATLIILAWINFSVVVIATKFNLFFVQVIAIILLIIILILKLKRIAYVNNSKVSN